MISLCYGVDGATKVFAVKEDLIWGSRHIAGLHLVACSRIRLMALPLFRLIPDGHGTMGFGRVGR